ncbi:MAG TPA: septum formation initiator family protein [bacterium]|nr:septum formation initiator family protein [bacterium]
MKALRLSAGKKKGRKIILIAAAVLGAVFILRSASGYFSMRHDRNSVRAEIERLKEENSNLEKKIANVYNDREYIEKIAREQLNLVKQGETVFIIAKE